ncbi:MAG: ABC transporter substrate-binding protein [Burkholderiales bacterium]
MTGRVRRRALIAVAACLAASAWLPARAQAGRTYRVGYLHPTDRSDPGYVAFRGAMTELGYVEGQNTTFDERFAEGRVDRLPAMAGELAANRVEVIVAVSPTAIRAARDATRTIPILMAFSGDDPVKSGFVASLARPGGNTTGLTTIAVDLAPKWIELLGEFVPGITTVAVLRSPGRMDHSAQIEAMRAATAGRGVHLHVVEVRGVDTYEEAFVASVRAGCQGMVVLSGPEFTRNRQRLVDLATRHRMPTVFQFAEFVVAGGLVSYGPDIADLSRRAARYVDQILRGANPGELPVEQPRKLLLVVNRRTAAALGLSVPSSLVLQADRVIG